MANKPFGKDDVAVPSGVPKAFAGQRQIDGTPTSHFTPPYEGTAGRRQAPMADRPAVPGRAGDSGMERAMQEHADREHPPKAFRPSRR